MVDVDGNEVDYDMGFGALFAGHTRRCVMPCRPQLTTKRYVTPCGATPTSRSCSPALWLPL